MRLVPYLLLLSLLSFVPSNAQSSLAIEESYKLAAKYMKSKPDSSWHYLNITLNKCKEQKNVEKEFSARLIQIVLYGDTEKFVEQDSIIAILAKMQDSVRPELKVFFLRSVGAAAQKNEDIERAESYFKMAFAALDTSFRDYQALKTTILTNLALTSKIKGDLNAAIDYNLEALKLLPKHPHILTQLGNIFKNIRDYPTAKQYYTECINSDPENVKDKHYCMKALQNLYQAVDDQDSSLILLRYLHKRPEECYRSTYFYVLVDYAALLVVMEPEDERVDSLIELAHLYAGSKASRKRDLATTKGDISKARARFANAESYYFEAIIGKYEPFSKVEVNQQADILSTYIHVRSYQGKSVPRDILEMWYEVNRRQYDEKLAGQLVGVERQFNLKQKEAKIRILNTENELNEIKLKQASLLIGVLSLVVGFIGLIAYAMRHRKKRVQAELVNKELELQLTISEKQRNEQLKLMIEQENEILKTTQIELEQRLTKLKADPNIILKSTYILGSPSSPIAIPSFGDILYVSKMKDQRNRAAFKIKDGEKYVSHNILSSLDAIEEENVWPSSIFFRIHQSCIVNIYNLAASPITGDKVNVINGDQLPLARRRAGEFQKFLAQRKI